MENYPILVRLNTAEGPSRAVGTRTLHSVAVDHECVYAASLRVYGCLEVRTEDDTYVGEASLWCGGVAGPDRTLPASHSRQARCEINQAGRGALRSRA